MVAIFDDVGLRYVVGGSIASSLMGEPRSTVDIDIAVSIDGPRVEPLLDACAADFFVPVEFAREAIATRSSFNLIERSGALKVDVFVLGDDLLDRNQMARRVQVTPSDLVAPIWVTSAEDQVLRKLDWFVRGGSTSDRQWRDIVGLLRIQAGHLDLDYLRMTANAIDLASDLERAIDAAS